MGKLGSWQLGTDQMITPEDTDSTEGNAAGMGWHSSGMGMGWGRRSGDTVVSILPPVLATNTNGVSALSPGLGRGTRTCPGKTIPVKSNRKAVVTGNAINCAAPGRMGLRPSMATTALRLKSPSGASPRRQWGRV